jgi:predicted nucleic acid-binding protein
VYYVDTSAAAKLVQRERGSAAMRRWAEAHDGRLFSSDLLRVELQRAILRTVPELQARARSVLDTILLAALSTELLERAARVEPAQLRSLDAIHLVAAMELGDELEGIVTYDQRLAEAARSNGIAAVSPR